MDVGLDMALVQAYTAPGGATLSPPAFLTLDPRTAPSLLGTHVHVVGHPEGHLKKWTQGEVVDSDGTWITFSAYALPGNSGSPVLDDAGHMVGILHRGPTAQDLVNADGVSEYSIGTASGPLAAAMTAPLPGAMRSIGASATAADVAVHQDVYLNARAASALVDGVPTPVLSALGTACDAALARTSFTSPDDMSAAFAPCEAAEGWIECRTDVTTSFGSCPPDADAWAARYQNVFQRWLALNGQLDLVVVSFGPAVLAATQAAGQASGASLLTAGLQQAGAPLDFNVANFLAAFDVLSYGGTSIVTYDRAYAQHARLRPLRNEHRVHRPLARPGPGPEPRRHHRAPQDPRRRRQRRPRGKALRRGRAVSIGIAVRAAAIPRGSKILLATLACDPRRIGSDPRDPRV